METLNLASYDVTEMTQQDMLSEKGGNFIKKFITFNVCLATATCAIASEFCLGVAETLGE